MSDRSPRVTAADVISVLERLGFQLTRQSGSHKIYRNESGKRVTVPYHAGKILHPKTLKSILRDADLTVDEFKKML
jgi:predicted RNA binding protein YcfA (HicA-like mRNA interferase family)